MLPTNRSFGYKYVINKFIVAMKVLRGFQFCKLQTVCFNLV